tara:strand:+ start:143 stop:913 length:771 start_codon:yes stop_codon:yes gene_type:complete
MERSSPAKSTFARRISEAAALCALADIGGGSTAARASQLEGGRGTAPRVPISTSSVCLPRLAPPPPLPPLVVLLLWKQLQRRPHQLVLAPPSLAASLRLLPRFFFFFDCFPSSDASSPRSSESSPSAAPSGTVYGAGFAMWSASSCCAAERRSGWRRGTGFRFATKSSFFATTIAVFVAVAVATDSATSLSQKSAREVVFAAVTSVTFAFVTVDDAGTAFVFADTTTTVSTTPIVVETSGERERAAASRDRGSEDE